MTAARPVGWAKAPVANFGTGTFVRAFCPPYKRRAAYA